MKTNIIISFQHLKRMFTMPGDFYLFSLMTGILIFALAMRWFKDKAYVKNEDENHIDDHFRLRRSAVSAGVIAAYVMFVLCFTVFSRVPTEEYTYEPLLFWSYLHIYEGSFTMLLENVLNIFLLVPVGMLLYTGFRKVGVYGAVVTGYSISAVVEILQLVMKRGLFEFDDLLHNTLGCVLGFVLCRWISGRSH